MRYILAFLIFVLSPVRVKGQMRWSAPVKECCSYTFTFPDPNNLYSFLDTDLKTSFSEKAFRNRPISRYTLKRISVFGDSEHRQLNKIDVDYTYDQQGNLVYLSYIKPQFIYTKMIRGKYGVNYFYDDIGNLIEIDYKNSFNTILQEKISFDPERNRKTCSFFNDKGVLISVEVQTYGKNGELIETMVFDKTGELVCRYTYGLDKSGHYCYFHYDSENKLHSIGVLPDTPPANDIILETHCDD